MRIPILLLAAAFLGAPLLPAAQAREVSTDFFYDNLDPYGDWIQTADYGYVWHPKDTPEGWRPYTVGSWAYTEAGWTWVSDEPFGPITFHYGRWTRLQDTGWVWVPDSEWAPAWVSWRRSDQYIGWAPLPPEATFQHDVGISAWSDSYYDIGPTQYSFVSAQELGSPRLATVILPQRENLTIIRGTRNITDISYRENRVYNSGPQYDVVVRESREPVRRLRLERREDVVYEGRRVRDDSLRANIADGALRVFAPSVTYRSEAAPSRVSRRVERVEVDRGWRNVAGAQEIRTSIQRDTPRAPERLPRQPSFTRSAAGAAAAGVQNLLNPNAPREGDRNDHRDARDNRDGRDGRDGGDGRRENDPRVTTPMTVAPGAATAPSDRPTATTETPLRPERDADRSNDRKGEKKGDRPDRPDRAPGAEERNSRPEVKPADRPDGTRPPGRDGRSRTPEVRSEGSPEAATRPGRDAAPDAHRDSGAAPIPHPPGVQRPPSPRDDARPAGIEPAPGASGGIRPPGAPARGERPDGDKPRGERSGGAPRTETPDSPEARGAAPARAPSARTRPEGLPAVPGVARPPQGPAATANPEHKGPGKKGGKGESDKDKEKEKE